MTKTVLITGCSSGLGKSTARHFAAQGWNVMATMRKPEPSLADEYPNSMLVEALDVVDPASVDAAVQAGIQRFGGLDAVVNNAGVTIVSIFETTPGAAIRRIFDTNLFGVMNVIQATVPQLRERGGGAIVNVTSGVGIAAVPLLSLYTASKQAVEGLSEFAFLRAGVAEYPGQARGAGRHAHHEFHFQRDVGIAGSARAGALQGLFRSRAAVDDELSVSIHRRAGGGRDDLSRGDRCFTPPALSRRAGCGGICPAPLVDFGRRIFAPR